MQTAKDKTAGTAERGPLLFVLYPYLAF